MINFSFYPEASKSHNLLKNKEFSWRGNLDASHHSGMIESSLEKFRFRIALTEKNTNFMAATHKKVNK